MEWSRAEWCVWTIKGGVESNLVEQSSPKHPLTCHLLHSAGAGDPMHPMESLKLYQQFSTIKEEKKEDKEEKEKKKF